MISHYDAVCVLTNALAMESLCWQYIIQFTRNLDINHLFHAIKAQHQVITDLVGQGENIGAALQERLDCVTIIDGALNTVNMQHSFTLFKKYFPDSDLDEEWKTQIVISGHSNEDFQALLAEHFHHREHRYNYLSVMALTANGHSRVKAKFPLKKLLTALKEIMEGHQSLQSEPKINNLIRPLL